MTTMTTESLKEVIKKELPVLLREDPALRAYILDIMRPEFADRRETQDRFYEILAEIRRDREEQTRKWEDHQTQQREEFNLVHEEIMALSKKHERAIGSLGSRWGMQTEAAFRNALAGILEENFGVSVANVTEYDDEGVVFGRPDQVELDVIIQNGVLLICELKSSVDKAAMYAFERKARFYEQRHARKASRLIVISPMIDAKARNVAEKLGIEMFSDSDEVETL